MIIIGKAENHNLEAKCHCFYVKHKKGLGQ